MILRNIRLMAVAPPETGIRSGVLRELVERFTPDAVCLIDARADDLDAARSVKLADGAVLVDGGEPGWHQAGPLLLLCGGGEVWVVGVASFCAASVLASFGRVNRTERVDPGELDYTVVRFRFLAGHLLSVRVEVAPGQGRTLEGTHEDKE